MTLTAVAIDGNDAFVVGFGSYISLSPYMSGQLSLYHHPNNHLHMTPSTTQSPPQSKTKCTTCPNKTCKSLARKPTPLNSKPKPAMASMAAVRCPSSIQTLRTTALHWNLRRTDAVWPASLPWQKRPSESSPLGNESPACFAKHTPLDVCQST